MIQIVTELSLTEGSQGQFELTFGPGGAWGRLFDLSPGYRGTTLLRDANNPLHFLVIDIWDSEEHRIRFIATLESEFAALMDTLAGWITSQRVVGVFKVRTGATVHRRTKPRGRGMRKGRA